ncbi:MAG: EAL domain-containing protein, partial [Comamonadaceae bacterium]|nr:EAL domain-containing protein [Comamonadaceae bacterium]
MSLPSTSPSAAGGAQSAIAMIARQAIVNAQQVVIGYELFNRSRSGAGHTAASDVIL